MGGLSIGEGGWGVWRKFVSQWRRIMEVVKYIIITIGRGIANRFLNYIIVIQMSKAKGKDKKNDNNSA